MIGQEETLQGGHTRSSEPKKRNEYGHKHVGIRADLRRCQHFKKGLSKDSKGSKYSVIRWNTTHNERLVISVVGSNATAVFRI